MEHPKVRELRPEMPPALYTGQSSATEQLTLLSLLSLPHSRLLLMLHKLPQEKGHATILQSCSSPGLLLTHQRVLLWFATTGNATPRNAQLWDHGTASSCTPEEPRS